MDSEPSNHGQAGTLGGFLAEPPTYENCVVIGVGCPEPDPGSNGVIRVGNANTYLEILPSGKVHVVGGTPDETAQAVLDAIAFVVESFGGKVFYRS